MSEFLDLQATHNPHRWILSIGEEISIGRLARSYMFSGVELAAEVRALDRTCERQVNWATAQYLSYALTGQIMDLDVWTPAVGRHLTHTRVIGHVGDEEILTVNAARGARPIDFEGQWAEPNLVPPLLGRRDSGRHRYDGIGGGRIDEGRVTLWIRPRGGNYPIDAAMLAVMGDYLPGGIGNAVGLPTFGTSLENTILFGLVEPTEWVMCDIRIALVQHGFAHGTMNMFSEGARLMAVGSQSVIVRERQPVAPAA